MEVTVRLGHPAEVIRWVVQETATDLVVMATHGRTGLHRERLGSVALDVLQAVYRSCCTRPPPLTNCDDSATALTRCRHRPCHCGVASAPLILRATWPDEALVRAGIRERITRAMHETPDIDDSVL